MDYVKELLDLPSVTSEILANTRRETEYHLEV